MSSGSVMGTRVLRREDPVLLTGEAAFVEDLHGDDALVALFVRSPQAHARIERIDTADAALVPGVVGVYVSADLDHVMAGSRFPLDPAFARTALTHDIVRFQGEPVAMVIAESTAAAADAVELVVVDYHDLPVSMNAEAALASDQPTLYPDRGSDTLITTFPVVEDLHRDAEVFVTGRFENSRMAAASIECHGIYVEPRGDGGLTVQIGTQGVHITRDGLAAALGLDPSMVDVIAPWVGGGFGAKGGWQAEHVAVAEVARRLDRPVSWKEDRSESLVSMHARDQVQHVRMGLRADATIASLEVVAIADVGAYPGLGALLPMATRLMSHGNYRIDQVQFDYAAVATNKGPVGAFRGAGRPQATYFLERMLDIAANQLGIDPVELRQRNLLRSDELPLTTSTGAAYDSGDYPQALQTAVDAIDYHDLRRTQAERRASGDTRQLGIGVACYVEVTAPVGTTEFAQVEVLPTGRVELSVGTCAHGQGHETTFAMIVADRLGVDVGDVDLVQSDTRIIPNGGGTNGSRSVQLAGGATAAACEQVLDRSKQLAADALEARIDDIEVVPGGLSVAGVPAVHLSWARLAELALDEGSPESDNDIGMPAGLVAAIDLDQGASTFPFGAHAVVVEVDTETGDIALLRVVAVDDCGTIINPMLVEGQQHGGLAAGIGQALFEAVLYDEHGNLTTGNFASYAMPSAAEFPSFETISMETPTPHNVLGAKGVGEAGTIASTPAVANAVVDALAHLGVRHIDIPLTPERIWRAIADASTGADAPDLPWPVLGRDQR